MNIFKFVKHDIPALETLKCAKVYQLMDQLEKGEKPAHDLIETVFSELWHGETYRNGIYKLSGYAFDFRPYLKTYLVKTKYSGWHELKAFNKGWIRKLAVTPSHILQIVELD